MITLDTIFLSVLNMSVTASYIIVAVILVRFLLRKAPKIFSYALWSVVLLRLLCPFTFESVIGLLPSGTEPLPQNIVYEQTPQIDTGIRVVDNTVNAILPPVTHPEASVNPLQIWVFVGRCIWLLGIAAMVIYSVIAFIKLKRKLIGAVPLQDNIYLADHIDSPFVMGFIKPKIYLPSNLAEHERAFIIQHEQTHINRLDYLTRILAFAALCRHWFNPLVWVAFVLSGKDMETSCDEAVMRTMGLDIRADYATALLKFASGKKLITATPLAFGEGDTKGRIHNVMRYKKPVVWVMVSTAIAVIVLLVSFASNQAASRTFPMTGSNLSDLQPLRITQSIGDVVGVEFSDLKLSADNFGLFVDGDFNYVNDETVRFLYDVTDEDATAVQLHLRVDENEFSIGSPSDWVLPEKTYTLFYYFEALQYLPQEAIQAMTDEAPNRYAIELSDGGSKTNDGRQIYYSKNGVTGEGDWLIRFDVQPMYSEEGETAFRGVGHDIIHLYYRVEESDIPASSFSSVASADYWIEEDTLPAMTKDELSALSIPDARNGQFVTWFLEFAPEADDNSDALEVVALGQVPSLDFYVYTCYRYRDNTFQGFIVDYGNSQQLYYFPNVAHPCAQMPELYLDENQETIYMLYQAAGGSSVSAYNLCAFQLDGQDISLYEADFYDVADQLAQCLSISYDSEAHEISVSQNDTLLTTAKWETSNFGGNPHGFYCGSQLSYRYQDGAWYVDCSIEILDSSGDTFASSHLPPITAKMNFDTNETGQISEYAFSVFFES